QTADDSGQCDLRPRLRHLAPFNALWDFALCGISRSMGLRALWDFALYGTSRPLGLRSMGLRALTRRHHLHKEPGTPPAGRLAGRFATVLADAHNHEVVRGHDPRTLPGDADHRVGVLRQRLAAVAVDPEEAPAVPGNPVG